MFSTKSSCCKSRLQRRTPRSPEGAARSVVLWRGQPARHRSETPPSSPRTTRWSASRSSCASCTKARTKIDRPRRRATESPCISSAGSTSLPFLCRCVMFRHSLAIVFALSASLVVAAEPDAILLWASRGARLGREDGERSHREKTPSGERILTQIHKPSLTPYLPAPGKANGRGDRHRSWRRT